MPVRILSYLPSPRLWKATVAARLTGVELDVRGDSREALEEWLWDFEARPLLAAERAVAPGSAARRGFAGGRLHKSEAFLRAHPFGTVPAAFSPDGGTGVFESNSILRLVARLARIGPPLLGRSAYEASRIDAYLDATLVFASDVQRYLLALREGDPVVAHGFAVEAVDTYLTGIERGLLDRDFLVGEDLTAADIVFACEVALLLSEAKHRHRLLKLGLDEVLEAEVAARYPVAWAQFLKLSAHPAFKPDLAPHLQSLGFPRS